MIELRSKTKIDNVKKALFKSKSLIEGLSFDVDELSDMPEEMLSVSTVNHTLFADPVGNTALEAYLTDKIFVRISYQFVKCSFDYTHLYTVYCIYTF